jgi:uncharacterized protein
MVTVITGASSGIGREAAILFARRGDAVVLAARRRDRLEELADHVRGLGVECLVVPIDLAITQDAGRLIDAAMERFGRIDVLVNNAGFGSQCELENMESARIEQMVQVNVLAVMELSRRVIPIMCRQKSGHIVNVASVAGFVAAPLTTIYSATKSAVVDFSKALRRELKGTGVGVTAVCPGATESEFFASVKGEIPYPKMVHETKVPVATAAQAIVRASRSKRAILFPTFMAWVYAMTGRLMPCLVDIVSVRYRDIILKEEAKRPPEPESS